MAGAEESGGDAARCGTTPIQSFPFGPKWMTNSKYVSQRYLLVQSAQFNGAVIFYSARTFMFITQVDSTARIRKE